MMRVWEPRRSGLGWRGGAAKGHGVWAANPERLRVEGTAARRIE